MKTTTSSSTVGETSIAARPKIEMTDTFHRSEGLEGRRNIRPDAQVQENPQSSFLSFVIAAARKIKPHDIAIVILWLVTLFLEISAWGYISKDMLCNPMATAIASAATAAYFGQFLGPIFHNRVVITFPYISTVTHNFLVFMFQSLAIILFSAIFNTPALAIRINQCKAIVIQ